MKIYVALILLTFAFPFMPTAHAVTFDWATVGNPGNADDIHGAGYGGVDYTYNISKHEVTNAQYTAFLNAVDPTGANANLGGCDRFLYNSNDGGQCASAASSCNGGRRRRQPSSSPKRAASNNPVDVSSRSSTRCDSPTGCTTARAAADTETGAYTIGNGVERSPFGPSAKFWIPSEDEWYKAAYHDASAGTAGVYFDYADRHAIPVSRYSDQPGRLNTPR